MEDIENNFLSSYDDILRWVTQGTVLGPIYFSILNQSKDELNLKVIISSFPENTKSLKEIRDIVDIEIMLEALDIMYIWEYTN